MVMSKKMKFDNKESRNARFIQNWASDRNSN
jgi:hypothetical protein